MLRPLNGLGGGAGKKVRSRRCEPRLKRTFRNIQFGGSGSIPVPLSDALECFGLSGG